MWSFLKKVSAFFLAAFVLLAPWREAPVQTAASVASSTVSLCKGVRKAPIEKTGPCTGFAVLSDLHVRSGWFWSPVFRVLLEPAMKDLASARDRLDAVVFNGDLTNEGSFAQWDILAEKIGQYSIAKQSFLVTGNHDNWGPNRDEFDNPVNGVRPTFIKYNRIISGRKIGNMYYAGTVNGNPFIVLGSEDDGTDAYLSPQQVKWFARAMEKAAAKGRPIFVFLHQPLNGTHGLPFSFNCEVDADPDDGGVGDQSARLEKILKKYDNVFLITGHIHAGFKNADARWGAKYASVEYLKNNRGNKITLVNSPSYTILDFMRGGLIAMGCGWIVEVHKHEVLLRARNFMTGQWLTSYDVAVPLV